MSKLIARLLPISRRTRAYRAQCEIEMREYNIARNASIHAKVQARHEAACMARR